MTSSSWSIWAQAPGTRSVVARARSGRSAPRPTSSTSQVCSVCPGGTGKSGSRGATRRRSKAHARPISAARSTAPGQRAKRRSCSAPERRWAVAADGSQPSSSARGRRARTAARAVASGRRAGVA